MIHIANKKKKKTNQEIINCLKKQTLRKSFNSKTYNSNIETEVDT